jgi:N6-adenosine-specific RNA methylase IME4
MWVTSPFLDVAMDVMRFRGFTYKTTIIWDKVVVGTGYWFRNRHEQMLVGTRGNVPAPAPGTQWPSVIVERKRGHSVKPEQSYQMIEQYFPNVPKIELNCRGKPRPGWDAWGNEVEEAAE